MFILNTAKSKQGARISCGPQTMIFQGKRGGEEGKEEERERERKKEAKREREREVYKREKRKKDQRIRDEGERYEKDSVNFGLENDQVILSFSF